MHLADTLLKSNRFLEAKARQQLHHPHQVAKAADLVDDEHDLSPCDNQIRRAWQKFGKPSGAVYKQAIESCDSQ